MVNKLLKQSNGLRLPNRSCSELTMLYQVQHERSSNSLT